MPNANAITTHIFQLARSNTKLKLVFDCDSEDLDDVVRIHDMLKELKIDGDVKTKQGILGINDIKNIYRKRELKLKLTFNRLIGFVIVLWVFQGHVLQGTS